jgi:hypothetical protein
MDIPNLSKSKLYQLLITIFLFQCFIVSAQDYDFVLDLTDDIIELKHYIVPKTENKIIIDGQASENEWKNADFTNPFIDIEGKLVPKFNTRAKLLWDNYYLYVYAELSEPHIWATLEKKDTIIFHNNDFEIFVDPSGTGVNYFEFEINAHGTVWDLLLTKPYRVGGKAINNWNPEALISSVHIEGSLNDPSDIDSYWSIEMAIPMKALLESKIKSRTLPLEGEQWRINFSRVQWQHEIIDGKYQRKSKNGKLLPEYNWVWCNQKTINMHQPERWGIIQFTTQSSGKEIDFIEDKDMLIEQVAFSLFRQTRFGSLKYLNNLDVYQQKQIKVKYSEEDTLFATFAKTLSGFEYNIIIPKTNRSLNINQEGIIKYSKPQKTKDFTVSTWVNGSKIFEDKVWREKLTVYKELGISEILVGGSPEFLIQLIPVASEFGIRVHAWLWTLNRPNDSIAMQHTEWYSVNRKGKNSLEYRAYVDYYQWLSPFSPGAREYIKDNVRRLLKVEGLTSIHLDYVRYVDVILGADLQPKYGLVQHHEMPEYDYGYHPVARKGFKEIFGIDPIEMEHPELSTEWRQYRLNAITSLVNEIADIVHSNGKKLTAAVFPFPEMSRQMVRQAWDDWNLDAAYPMLYNNFYKQDISWIGFSTRQCVYDVGFPIIPGLYIASLKDTEELEKAIRTAKLNGASGISIFTADGLDSDQKKILLKLIKDK